MEGRTVAQLQIRQVREEDFHVYTIVAENRVSVAAKDVPLLHSQLMHYSTVHTTHYTVTVYHTGDIIARSRSGCVSGII